jgi:hypothetical protein
MNEASPRNYRRRPCRDGAYADEWFGNLTPGEKVRAGGVTGTLVEVQSGPDSTRATAQVRIRTPGGIVTVPGRHVSPSHPEDLYLRADWARDVVGGNTRLGYTQWVATQMDADGFLIVHSADLAQEAMQAARTQLQDLAAGFPQRELHEPLSATIRRLQQALKETNTP